MLKLFSPRLCFWLSKWVLSSGTCDWTSIWPHLEHKNGVIFCVGWILGGTTLDTMTKEIFAIYFKINVLKKTNEVIFNSKEMMNTVGWLYNTSEMLQCNKFNHNYGRSGETFQHQSWNRLDNQFRYMVVKLNVMLFTNHHMRSPVVFVFLLEICTLCFCSIDLECSAI